MVYQRRIVGEYGDIVRLRLLHRIASIFAHSNNIHQILVEKPDPLQKAAVYEDPHPDFDAFALCNLPLRLALRVSLVIDWLCPQG